MYIFPVKGVIKRILEFLFWIGLAVTVVIGIAAYVFPDSLVSVTSASVLLPESPGDFTRGLEGPLFIVRDIMLAVFILVSFVYAIYNLIKRNANFQSITLFLGLVISIFGGVDDMQYLYTGRNFLLDGFRFSRFSLSVTIMLLFFLAAVFSKYFKAHTMLEKTEHDLKVSENKYSLLMESC